ncbi:MAG: sensor histidine kinase [Propionibacteriaceae bacterium]
MKWLEIFGSDDDWERQAPPLGRHDIILIAIFFLLSVFLLECLRSFLDFSSYRPRWEEYLALALSISPLIWRRRFPIAVMYLSLAMMMISYSWVPEISQQLNYSLIIFFAIYSGVAWAKDRQHVALSALLLILIFMLWVGWDILEGGSLDRYLVQSKSFKVHGIFPQVTAWVLYMVVFNFLYVAGAVVMGMLSWRKAHSEGLQEQSVKRIAEQAAVLKDQAVIEERLRIARELHDVVAHHVSVMGIQAAGARRAFVADPESATFALSQVESSAREAIRQMQGLLGALRATNSFEENRTSQPTLADIPKLIAEMAVQGLTATVTVIESEPGGAATVPMPVQLSLYRTIQEALANVLKHSTATTATVTIRQGSDSGGQAFMEVEILDAGTPRSGTSGTGLGLLGIRERIASHGGTSEIGPRITGGYRVRARFLTAATATSHRGAQ